jgi:hypothetical protein
MNKFSFIVHGFPFDHNNNLCIIFIKTNISLNFVPFGVKVSNRPEVTLTNTMMIIISIKG